jgi:hypothetical protein
MTISTQTHHIETQHADGTQYQVFFRWIEKLEWSVSITNVETQQQDHGIFRRQYDGLFGIDGLEDGPEVGFPSEHIQMIQNEICQDLMAHGELQSAVGLSEDESKELLLEIHTLVEFPGVPE